MKNNLYKLLPVLFIVLFSLGLRIYAPTADLPPDISFSGSIYTDEGNQCHNSRSRILYRDWYPDEWRISLYSPIIPYFQYLIFKFFGVGLLQERMVSYIFAFFSLLVFYLILKSYFNFTLTLLGTFFIGVNFFLVMYSKIGTFETPMIFWMILSLYFIEKFRSSLNPFYLTLSGISAFMAFVFKNLAGYFIPVPVVAVLLWIFVSSRVYPLILKESIKQIFSVLLGVGFACVLWYILFYIPNRQWILSVPGQFISNQVLPRSLAQAVQNFYGFNWKEQFYKIPVIWSLSILYIPIFFRNLIRRRFNVTELGFFLFFLFHTGFFMFMNHRPTRYLIPVIPAMIFMTLLLLDKVLSRSSALLFRYSRFQKALVFSLDIIWLSLAASFCFLPLYDRYIHPIQIPTFSIYYFIFSALVIFLLYSAFRIFQKFSGKSIKIKLRNISLPFVFLLAGTSMIMDIGHYLEWDRNKTYTVFNMSRELGDKLDNAYIAGLTAPVAVLENRHRSLFLYPGFVNWDEDTLEKYPLTHALLASFNQEISSFFRKWPDKMQNARLLRVYNVKDQFLHLYSLVDPFIAQVKRLENNHLRFHIVNPKGQPIETRMGKVLFFSDPHSGHLQPGDFSIEKIKKNYLLDPGENAIDLKDTWGETSAPVSILFFLDMNPWDNEFRYEAEKFPKKVGIDKRNPEASAGSTRSFFQRQHKAGYLSFGPFVPYSEGFLAVDFYLKCSRIHSRIKPVIKLDIFSYGDKKPLASRILKPRDLVRDKFGHYRLVAVIPGIRYLEFRAYAEGWSDIDFDYVNVVYYQGFLLNLNGNEEGSTMILKNP